VSKSAFEQVVDCLTDIFDLNTNRDLCDPKVNSSDINLNSLRISLLLLTLSVGIGDLSIPFRYILQFQNPIKTVPKSNFSLKLTQVGIFDPVLCDLINWKYPTASFFNSFGNIRLTVYVYLLKHARLFFVSRCLEIA